MSKNFFPKTLSISYLVLISAFWLGVFYFSRSFNQGFHLIDDHEIIAINHQVIAGGKFSDHLQGWLNAEAIGIRFRPLWIIFKLLRIQILGQNVSLWIALNMIIAIMTTWVWFLFGLAMNWQHLTAIGFALMIVLGDQSAIYFRLGTPETLSTLVLAFVFYFSLLSTRYNSNYKTFIYNFFELVFLILLALSKENFILILPALVIFKIVQIRFHRKLTWKAACLLCLPYLIVISLVFILNLGFISFLKSSSSLSSSYADNFGLDVTRLSVTFQSLTQKVLWPFIVFSITCIGVLSLIQKRFLLGELTEEFILCCAIIIPQIALYSKSGIYERYLLPAIIGYAFLTAASLRLIAQSSKLLSRLLSLSLILMITISFIKVNYPQFQRYATQRDSFNQLLTLISTNTQKDDAVLVVINPRSFYEFGLSLQKFLMYQLNRKSVYLSSYGSTEADFYTDLVQEAEQAYRTLDPKVYLTEGYTRFQPDLNSSKIKSIIIFPPFQAIFLNNSSQWFKESNFDKYQIDLNLKDHFPFTIIGNSKVTVYFKIQETILN